MSVADGNTDPAAVQAGILTSLKELSRLPFQEELAKALTNAPTPENYRELAKTDPEKWSRAVFALARLSGVTNTSETLHRHVISSKDELLSVVHKRFGEAAAIKTGEELGYTRERTLALLQNLPVIIEAEED